LSQFDPVAGSLLCTDVSCNVTNFFSSQSKELVHDQQTGFCDKFVKQSIVYSSSVIFVNKILTSQT